jgi:squalene-hopene/tetraprenyl-beta-curcumene cyclase
MRNTTTVNSLDQAIQNAHDWSVNNLKPGGYWVGLLETNCTMEAEWILGMHVMGVKDDPKTPEVLRTIRTMQRPDGAWGVYFGAEAGDLNATVECYAALRATGSSPDDPALVKAREWIWAHGGVKSVRVFTKIWLALVGEWPWDGTPTLPPEMVWFPTWFPFSLYNFGSWARATIVPLTILSARRPVYPLPEGCRLDELFPEGRTPAYCALPKPSGSGTDLAWAKFFALADKALAAYVKFPFHPGRELAIKSALEWILSRQEADGCWAGIQPPWIYSLMALRCEGYALDHPVVKAGIRAFDAPWAHADPRGNFLQACTSPVWDTLLTQLAFLDCGWDCQDPTFLKSLEYTLEQQILAKGDWCVKSPAVQPGGWAFEYENDCYPDIDDTAVALIVLARAKATHPQPERLEAALKRAEGWVRGMVSSNGAWGAFDKDNWEPLIRLIPFCDFGEALDPPSVDVTAHVVEAFGWMGKDLSDPMVARAVDYLRKEQEEDGSWFGRWGVNHIYGTGAVLPALEQVGENMQAEYVRKAAEWLVSRQNSDGGWGESCASYMDIEQRGRGPSTASQTGWALMALVSTHDQRYRPAVQRGIDYLVQAQTAEGSWDEPYFTGTGFPGYGGGARTDLRKGRTLKQGKELSRGFMLRYHMYRHYFPLMALGRCRPYLEKA